MLDPRTELFKNLKYDSIRINFSSYPIVLLCGGPVKEKQRPDDPDIPIHSLRHAITRKQSEYEFFRPEEITNWQVDGIFKNLMDFEADLAAICSLVVIVLESPGAIAELGAFSQLSDLSKRLIVIKSADYDDSTSFIDLGILRYIANEHESSVKSYPWSIPHPPTLPDIADEIVEDVIEDVATELKKLPKNPKLKPSNNSHIIVLICEVIRLFVALKEKEIFNYLILFGVELTKEKLKSKLFLLEQFNLITREKYSDSVFYLNSGESYHQLQLTLEQGEHIDTLRTTIECIEFYNSSAKEKHRSRAIKNALKGGT